MSEEKTSLTVKIFRQGAEAGIEAAQARFSERQQKVYTKEQVLYELGLTKIIVSKWRRSKISNPPAGS
jgi:hypothetical protein